MDRVKINLQFDDIWCVCESHQLDPDGHHCKSFSKVDIRYSISGEVQGIMTKAPDEKMVNIKVLHPHRAKCDISVRVYNNEGVFNESTVSAEASRNKQCKGEVNPN